MSELTITSIQSVVRLFIMILVGIIGTKAGVITKEVNDHITKLLVQIILPIMIVSSYFTAYDSQKTKGFLQSALIGMLLYLTCIAIVTFLFPKKNNPDWGIDRVSAMIGNCGFLGIPLISLMIGQEGVMYMTGFLTANNVVCWTYGRQSVAGNYQLKGSFKLMINPSTIAISIGLIIYFLQIKLPTVLTEVLTQVGNCNTPLAMIVAGSSIARSNIANDIKDLKFYIVIIFKHFIEGLIAIPIIRLCRADGTVALCCYIAACTPVAALINVFAIDAGKNSSRASSMFWVSTLLFMVTLPIMISIYSVLQ